MMCCVEIESMTLRGSAETDPAASVSFDLPRSKSEIKRRNGFSSQSRAEKRVLQNPAAAVRLAPT